MQRPATLATAGRDFKLEAASLCGLNKCQANEQNKTKLPEKQGEREGREGEGSEGTSKEETDLTDLIVSMQQKCANPKTARERERENQRCAPSKRRLFPSGPLLSTIPATAGTATA